jgi:hypothetical protein
MGKALVQQAQKALWHSSQGRPLLNYLRGRRLKDETIVQARLGYIPRGRDGRWLVIPYEQWGIDSQSPPPSHWERSGLTIPNGLLIPWFEGPILWRITIRRVEGLDKTPHHKQGRYGQISGSGEGLYNVDSLTPDKPAMLVEGEIDALSVMQEASDLLSCVATGSSYRGRLEYWRDLLETNARYTLQSFDSDEAGEQGAQYWQSRLPRVLRWPTEHWKDPNALLRSEPNGICTLREWVRYGIEVAQVEFERAPPASW